MKKTTVKNLKEKMNIKQLQAQIEADKTQRSNDFLKELEALKKKYNCEIACQRVEEGIGNSVSVQFRTLVIAI